MKKKIDHNEFPAHSENAEALPDAGKPDGNVSKPPMVAPKVAEDAGEVKVDENLTSESTRGTTITKLPDKNFK